MKSMTVGDLKTDFSSVLSRIQTGEQIQILFGRRKKPVAVISPVNKIKENKRILGTYEGKAFFSEKDNGKISLEEFLGITEGE